MAVTDKTQINEETRKDIDFFTAKMKENETGLFPDEEFKPFRLTHGIYGQRQDNVQMIRAKVPGGQMTSDQMRVFGELARDEAPMGIGHVTTRQNFQFHYIKLARVPAIMNKLAEHDLTAREACGNAVRNITCSPVAGIDGGEVFDPFPYSKSAFRKLLRRPEFAVLPRKFKISFNGTERDWSQSSINDIGLQARVKIVDGKPQRGFRMVVGGGLGSTPQDAWEFSEFIPENEVLPYVEAILTHFNEKGERKNRSAARLKFLIRKEGIDTFKEEVAAIHSKLPKEIPFELEEVGQEPAANGGAKLVENGPEGYSDWVGGNTWPQKQPGYRYALIKLTLGDMPYQQFFDVADIADKYGNGTLRTTNDQNLLLPWLKVDKLDEAYTALKAAGLADLGPDLVGDVTSCPGADTCNLGLTASRGLAAVLTEKLAFEKGKNEDLAGTHIKISGCPNSCGQHHVGTMGFFGMVRKADGRDSPHFNILIGGGVNDGEGGSTFGRLVGRVPSRRITKVIDAFVAEYRANKKGDESYETFLRGMEKDRAREIVSQFNELNIDDPDIFMDNGSDEPFKLEGLGASECA